MQSQTDNPAAGADRSPVSTAHFAAAVFVSAFLLFQVQPLIGKAILPWFGGSPGVWTTCMLFFQAMLFGGYAWSHLLASRVSVRGQIGIQLALIAATLFLLRVLPESTLQSGNTDSPVISIILVLATTIGLPYFLLATTGPLLQSWFAQSYPGRSPYRLYALSNAGSLLALLSYPFVVEPLLALRAQSRIWMAAYWAFAALVAACAFSVWKREVRTIGELPEHGDAKPDTAIGTARAAAWFVPAMLASATYLSTTNQVCQGIAVVPFLWVVPLSLYLASFIVCFEHDRWYRRRWWAITTIALLMAVCGMMLFGLTWPLTLRLSIEFAAMFSVCMTCHGELARLRPSPQKLTSFYLLLSAGGAAGGLLVAVAAPMLFPDFWELHLCLLAGLATATAVLFDEGKWMTTNGIPLVALAGLILAVVVAGTVFTEEVSGFQTAIAMTRNFYGVLETEPDADNDALVLRHGSIIHGVQYRRTDRQMIPTTYYSRRTGIGRTIEMLQSRKPAIRAGLAGLGVGTLAAYGRESDVLRFYEINQDVVRHAETYFTFLKRSPATIETAVGDARMLMNAESPQNYDLLVLDAFSGDAVPTHLLTREAFAVYLRHVADDGIVAVHISNRHFGLRPVVDAVAAEYQLHSVTIYVPELKAVVDPGSEWVLLSRTAESLDDDRLRRDVAPPQHDLVLWTDDFSNLFQVMR
ncbi:MAG: fused MFS/spermidine synthase [Planctomycetaceae bacterium]